MSTSDTDECSMSILTTQASYSDEHFTLFGDRTSASFAKRDTAYFKLVPTENKKFRRGYQEFCTGSSYIGEWNSFGFCGQGTYIYPHGNCPSLRFYFSKTTNRWRHSIIYFE